MKLHRSYCCRFYLLIFFFSCSGATIDRPVIDPEPVDLVDPLVDSANSRWFFFNSATRPFGMVNLSPDMIINGAWNSGYRYNEDTIRSFSHVHAWQLSAIPVFPTNGEFKGHLGADIYGSSYSHQREKVKPGYHQVFLDTYRINVELTSTTRVGFHRYTFPKSNQAQILFDFSTFLGPCDTKAGHIKKINDRRLEGYATMAATRRRPKPINIYFVVDFESPFEEFSVWKDKRVIPGQKEISGLKTGGFVNFSTEENEQRLMKVAISYTSIEAARTNMNTELSHWNFDGVVKNSRSVWNEWLRKIKVKGAKLDDQRRFYTDLWHALQGRRIISDVEGTYPDLTGDNLRIGQIPLDEEGLPRFNHYNSDSFWGAQWTIQTLWQLVYPKVAEEFVQSMLLMYKDGGLIPRGPSGGNYTYVMTGASSTPFVVGAYQKGIRNFDEDLAYEALKKNHMPGGLMSKAGYEHNSTIGGGLDYYIERGYIPYPLPEGGKGFHENGSGQTLEYAYQDACLAELAKALKKDDDYEYFFNRSKNYRYIWNEDRGWMWLRNINGEWQDPFDELLYGKGFVESNAAQATWFVPHDVHGLATLMGGNEAFVNKLNTSFEKSLSHDFTSGKAHSSETIKENRRVYINYGNQPSMQTAFMFNYAEAPWLTQYWSRRVVEKVYSGVSPHRGYNGDEDQGLMGALAVLMKMGIFSLDGGTSENPGYEIGSPIFDEISIELDPRYYPGGQVRIIAENQASDNYYVQSATWNGEVHNSYRITHEAMTNGGELLLELGKAPNKNWGIDQ